MIKKSQNGEVSILFLAFIVMSVTLIWGILAVGDHKVARVTSDYAAQSAANGAAQAYGKEFVHQMKMCMANEIEEKMEEELPLETSEVCPQEELNTCTESTFETCELEIPVCFPDDYEEMVEKCWYDEEVIGASEDKARAVAGQLGHEYDTEETRISFAEDEVKVRSILDHESVIPLFGKSERLESTGQSRFIIKQR
jgi:hypothetical protein